jgi:carboxymethylenebutenolidase
MRLPTLLLAVVASSLALACQGPPRGESTAASVPVEASNAEPVASTVPVAAAKPDGKPSLVMTNTGILSEQEFAALHELTDAKAPPLRGVEIDVGGAKAYLSLPEGAKAPLPGVVVIHEWYGLNDHVRHWTDRLAADGYAAVAVDLYGGKVATTSEEAMAMMKAVDDAKARELLGAARWFLAEDPRVKAGKRGVIGWCFGGGWSLQHALAQPDVDAAVIYYGRLEMDPKVLAELEAPVMGVFGDQDKGIPPEAVEEFAAAMKQAGESLELHRYDAPHGFANPSGANYDAKAAEDAWGKVRAFFGEHLRG